jgi:hypothetical protein
MKISPEPGNGDARRTLKVPMHGGMLERDRSVGWRTGPTRVPLPKKQRMKPKVPCADEQFSAGTLPAP